MNDSDFSIESLKDLNGFDVLVKNIVSGVIFKTFTKAQAMVRLQERQRRLVSVGVELRANDIEQVDRIEKEINHLIFIGDQIKSLSTRDFDQIKIDDALKVHVSDVNIPEAVIGRAAADLDKTNKPEVLKALYKGLGMIEGIMESTNPSYDADYEPQRGGPEGLIFELVTQAIDWVRPPQVKQEMSYTDATMYSFFENNYERDIQELDPFLKTWDKMTIGIESGRDFINPDRDIH